jgi:hypothetical protein
MTPILAGTLLSMCSYITLMKSLAQIRAMAMAQASVAAMRMSQVRQCGSQGEVDCMHGKEIAGGGRRFAAKS